MILVGSQRGGAGNLARHLLNAMENDHVSVQELRGFVADDLPGALAEAHAISKATQCKQFMFSLSLNPPKGQEASLENLMRAADEAESKLGLQGQPRAVVVHEKKDRRHIHVVWSRIDAETMKAVNLPFFKQRLAALSKELYLEHGWELPDGHKENGWKNPLNFTLAEWQQAQRLDLDPREVKQIFQSAWRQSDSMPAFRAALEEHGYWLARGDRRGFVAMDINGEVFSVSRWAGIKTRELNQRLGDPDMLPRLDEVRKTVHARLTGRVRDYLKEGREIQARELAPEIKALREMIKAHRQERVQLEDKLEQRRLAETKARSARLHKGVRGVWELLTGKARAIRRQNEKEAFHACQRDRDQREAHFTAQSREKQMLQTKIELIRTRQRRERIQLAQRIAQLWRLPGFDEKVARTAETAMPTMQMHPDRTRWWGDETMPKNRQGKWEPDPHKAQTYTPKERESAQKIMTAFQDARLGRSSDRERPTLSDRTIRKILTWALSPFGGGPKIQSVKSQQAAQDEIRTGYNIKMSKEEKTEHNRQKLLRDFRKNNGRSGPHDENTLDLDLER